METYNEINVEMSNLRVCKNCHLSEPNCIFQKYRKICTKCNSKISNEKIKVENPSYFREKMKQCYVYHGKVGRPKKEKN